MSLRTNGFKVDTNVFEADPFYSSPLEMELINFLIGNDPERTYVIPAEDLALFIKLMINRYRGMNNHQMQLRQACSDRQDEVNEWKDKSVSAEEKIAALNLQISGLTAERDQFKGRCDDYRLEKLKFAREINKFVNE